MKVVLSWVFDHITVAFDKVDIADVIKQFSSRTTEIESVFTVSRKVESFLAIKVQKLEHEVAYCVDESGKSYEVQQAKNQQLGEIYLIFFDDEQRLWRFANAKDLGASREFLLPSLNFTSHATMKLLLSRQETILTIDNNAIAHRPDLWSHRGIAREIAAICGYELKSLEHMVTQKRLVIDPIAVSATSDSPFSITLEDKQACGRFAGLFIKSVQNQSSFFDIVAKLSLVDCRAINAVVDFTNYVLFDIGQPLHAYDADTLTNKRLVARYADQGSELLLLDGETVKLSHHDIIIADGLNTVSVAGVMGGHETGVAKATKSIFVESACFDPVSIRETVKRIGKRTEAALRFSRGIDQNQNVFGIMRFLYLLDAYHITYAAAGEIQSAGLLQDAVTMRVKHDFIEKRIGVTISENDIVSFLSRLGFRIEKIGTEYAVTAPSFRAKKDISIPEDIVEEIVRLFGYDQIELQLPQSILVPKQSVTTIRMMRTLKNMLSFGFKMRELHTYSVFDESFLGRIAYDPNKSVFLKNPISEHRKRLVTSLVPQLLEAVYLQKETEESLRFYEIARVWHQVEEDRITEEETFAGVFFDKKILQHFYDFKAYFERLVALFGVSVVYANNLHDRAPWHDTIHSACIIVSGDCVGHIGKLSQNISEQLFDAKTIYLFECKLLPFLQQKSIVQFQEIPKFPAVVRDISLMLSHKMPVADLQVLLRSFSEQISNVFVIDIFEKKEWRDERAVTFRLVFQDKKKTLLSEEVDTIVKRIQTTIQTKGIQVR